MPPQWAGGYGDTGATAGRFTPGSALRCRHESRPPHRVRLSRQEERPPLRGRWQLWVSLPPEPVFDEGGLPVLDARGKQKVRYPKTTKVVEARGKKAAERLLEARIAELE